MAKSYSRMAAIFAASFLGVSCAWSVPALRTPISVVQPDGSVVELHKVGDEHFHLLLTDDDCIVAEHNGAFEFARVLPDGSISPSGVPASSSMFRSADADKVATRLSDLDPLLLNRISSRSSLRQPMLGPGRISSSFPATGDANVLVVLVEFKDVKFNLPDPYAYVDGMLNTEGFSDFGATGCAKEYFHTNSSGTFKPHFNVFGPVTLPNDMAYYGANDVFGNDVRPDQVVVDAAKLIDDSVNFADYDMDGDGYVDNIFIIYAGQGEATYGGADTIWPHSGDLLNHAVYEVFDKKVINHYACCNEWLSDRPDGVGTFIHEFSHVIGLPDLYSTAGGRLSATPSSWSVLDYGPYNNGGCTPPNYSAYERYAMGWTKPEVLSEARDLMLEELAASNSTCIIPVAGNSNEFFLIENRQQTGWDTYLPGHGMMVWHVDYNASAFEGNTVNNDAAHQRVDIIEANALADGFSADVMAGYPWPGTSGATHLGFSSTPRLAAWNGSDTGIDIDNIEETPDGRILAHINGGSGRLDPPASPSGMEIGPMLSLSWLPVDDAESYEVRIFARYEGEAGILKNDMGSGSSLSLPEGWTASTDAVNSTSGNYGAASPSLRMENDGEWLQSPLLNADVKRVRFWHKGTQTSGSSLDVLASADGSEWTTVASVAPENNRARTFETEIPAGYRQIRFSFTKGKGRVALDDIEIEYGMTDFEIPGSPFSTTATSLSATVPHTHADKLSFRVRAIAGDLRSLWSEWVDMPHDPSALIPVATPSGLRLYGRTVISESSRAINAYDIAGRIVAHGAGTLELPSAGIFIVTDGISTMKAIISR